MNLPIFCYVLLPGRKKKIIKEHASNLLPTYISNRAPSLPCQPQARGAAAQRPPSLKAEAREPSASQGRLGQGDMQMHIKGSSTISEYV